MIDELLQVPENDGTQSQYVELALCRYQGRLAYASDYVRGGYQGYRDLEGNSYDADWYASLCYQQQSGTVVCGGYAYDYASDSLRITEQGGGRSRNFPCGAVSE